MIAAFLFDQFLGVRLSYSSKLLLLFSLPFLCKLGMVHILDGNSEIGAQVRTNLCYLMCLLHLIRSSAVTNWIFFSPKIPFFPKISAQHDLSNLAV